MGTRHRPPSVKPHWRTIRVWRRTGATLLPIVESAWLAELHWWRAGKVRPEQWYIDCARNCTLWTPSAVDWADFPDAQTGTLAAVIAEELRSDSQASESFAMHPYTAQEASRAPPISYTYEVHWRWFTVWCERQSFPSLPASGDTIALYLADIARTGFAKSTIGVAIAAITKVHTLAGHPRPCSSAVVRQVLSQIRGA